MGNLEGQAHARRGGRPPATARFGGSLCPPRGPAHAHPHVLPGGGGCLARGRASCPEQARLPPSFGGLGTHTAASGSRRTRRQTSPCFLNHVASPDCDLFPDSQASGLLRGWPAAPQGALPRAGRCCPASTPGFRPSALEPQWGASVHPSGVLGTALL